MKLSDSIETLAGVGPENTKRMRKLGIFRIGDLLYHFPYRYDDFSQITRIKDLKPGGTFTIEAQILQKKRRRSFRRRLTILETLVADDSGSILVVWFNQPYLDEILKEHQTYLLAGPVTFYDSLQMQNPLWELAKPTTIHLGRIAPVYPLTSGIYPKWLRSLLKRVLDKLPKFQEYLPKKIVEESKLISFNEALRTIHFPATLEAAEKARTRLAFDELFFYELKALLHKKTLRRFSAHRISFQKSEALKFTKQLPFTLTESQKKAAEEIAQDLARPFPANRLLAGDVGSGKTVVAALSALQVLTARLKVAVMVPTEILAQQHFATFSHFPLFNQFPIFLITSAKLAVAHLGDQKNLKKSELSKKLNSKLPLLLIGTHALIQNNLGFTELGLVIVDEQHRFGVQQRAELLRNPNVTNTPESTEQNLSKIVEKDLSYKLNGIFWKIQEELGRFGRERQYADALEKKLQETGIIFTREAALPVAGRKSNFADFIVDEKVLVEAKAKPFVLKEDYYQTLRYLKTANLELGLIVNFRQEYLKPKRILNPDFSSRHSDKFGISGRLLMPHFLSMTATPIPRTLALTLYGDLEISYLTDQPAGRKKVITKIVTSGQRQALYQKIDELMTAGQQVFIICPLIDPSDKLGVRAATEELQRVQQEIFPHRRVGMLHGKLTVKEKERVVQAFAEKNLDILVSTSVVEVGVDFAGATVMIIEGAERFGLAQLHQLRGRVGRSDVQSYCFLLPETLGEKSFARLSALTTSHNGLELSELDLKLRGPGNLYGQEQSGYPQFKIANIFNSELLEAARKSAQDFLENFNLKEFPLIAKKIEEMKQNIHRE